MNCKNSSTLVLAIAALTFMIGSTKLLAQSPYFPNFNSNNLLVLNGSANAPVSNGTVNVLRLNPASVAQVGSAWFNIQQPIAAGFSTTFTFQITNTSPPSANFPADGLAFVIQNSEAGTSAIGPGGGGIGYGSNPDSTGSGITNSLAVEFDTFQNTGDPNANHVAIQSCGTGPNTSDEASCNYGINSSLTFNDQTINLSDGNQHTVTIEYTPPPSDCGECSGTLQVTVDGNALFAGSGASVPELNGFLGLNSGSAWVGFTGATGAFIENNDIVSWTFTPHSSTSITQTLEPGVQAKYIFGSYNYKLTPDPSTNTGGDVVQVTTVLVDPNSFDPGPNFPGAQCIVYQDTGGMCVEFQADCLSGPDCKTGTYPLETNYNVAPGTVITNPGFLTAPGQPCPPPSTNPFSRNIITQFSQTRDDPVTKGSGGPGYNCFVAVENVSYSPADVALGKFASPFVKSGSNLTYGIAVLNLGPATAQGIVVTDIIPSGTSFVSANVAIVSCTLSGCSLPPPGAEPCAFNAGSATVTCAVSSLSKFSLNNLTGIGVKLVVTVNSAPGSTVKNTATVQALNPDPRPSNNSFTAVTRVTH